MIAGDDGVDQREHQPGDEGRKQPANVKVGEHPPDDQDGDGIDQKAHAEGDEEAQRQRQQQNDRPQEQIDHRQQQRGGRGYRTRGRTRHAHAGQQQDRDQHRHRIDRPQNQQAQQNPQQMPNGLFHGLLPLDVWIEIDGCRTAKKEWSIRLFRLPRRSLARIELNHGQSPLKSLARWTRYRVTVKSEEPILFSLAKRSLTRFGRKCRRSSPLCAASKQTGKLRYEVNLLAIRLAVDQEPQASPALPVSLALARPASDRLPSWKPATAPTAWRRFRARPGQRPGQWPAPRRSAARQRPAS